MIQHNSGMEPDDIVRDGLRILAQRADKMLQEYKDELKSEMTEIIEQKFSALTDFVSASTLRLEFEHRQTKSEIQAISNILNGVRGGLTELIETSAAHERENRRQRENVITELRQLSRNVEALQSNLDALRGDP